MANASLTSPGSPGTLVTPNGKGQAGRAMRIHPVAAILVALGWPMMGFFLVLVANKALGLQVPRLVGAIGNLFVGAFGLFLLFPKLYRAPFGPTPLSTYLLRIGFYPPARAWRHVLLGIVLAGCTLSGMLAASLLTGRYTLDWSTVNLTHFVFSLNPGIFEEAFYRGIMVMLLLPLTRSLGRALGLQIALFGLAHIKGTDGLALVDAFSVMVIAAAFTYSAYKTRALLAGMVFHFLHDAFLFFVQVPGGVYKGLQENVVFYSLLWAMVGGACVSIWYASERLNVRAERQLYQVAASAGAAAP